MPTARPIILPAIDRFYQTCVSGAGPTSSSQRKRPPGKGGIATACTCRPDHFEHRLKSSADLQGGIEIFHVGAFDDPEPGALLRKRGLTREGLPPALVDLRPLGSIRLHSPGSSYLTSLSFEVELKISPPQQLRRLRSRLLVAAGRRDASLALEDATLQSRLEAMLALLDQLSIDRAHDLARRGA